MISKKEQTQKKIFETAIRLFSTLGYNATTTSEIAKQAAVSEAIIFKYFKNKENLLKEIASSATSQIIENISIYPFLENVKLSKEYSLKDFLYSIIKERLTFFDKNHEIVKILLIEMQYSDAIKRQVFDCIILKASPIFEFIKDVLVKKGLTSEIEASAILRIILGTIESVFFQQHLLCQNISDENIEKEVNAILAIIENGCGVAV